MEAARNRGNGWNLASKKTSANTWKMGWGCFGHFKQIKERIFTLVWSFQTKPTDRQTNRPTTTSADILIQLYCLYRACIGMYHVWYNCMSLHLQNGTPNRTPNRTPTIHQKVQMYTPVSCLHHLTWMFCVMMHLYASKQSSCCSQHEKTTWKRHGSYQVKKKKPQRKDKSKIGVLYIFARFLLGWKRKTLVSYCLTSV